VEVHTPEIVRLRSVPFEHQRPQRPRSRYQSVPHPDRVQPSATRETASPQPGGEGIAQPGFLIGHKSFGCVRLRSVAFGCVRFGDQEQDQDQESPPPPIFVQNVHFCGFAQDFHDFGVQKCSFPFKSVQFRSFLFSFVHFCSLSDRVEMRMLYSGLPAFSFGFVRFYSVTCEANHEWTPMDANRSLARRACCPLRSRCTVPAAFSFSFIQFCDYD
jgi:hypothetical protein